MEPIYEKSKDGRDPKLTRKRINITADIEFVDMIRDLYPNQRSDYFRTKMIKKQLDEIAFKKKASAFDMFYIMGSITVIFLIILVVGLVYSSANTRIQQIDAIDSDSKALFSQEAGKFSERMDNALIYVFFGLCITTLILAALVRVHWIFIPFFIFAMIFMIIYAGLLSNVVEEATSSGILAEEAAKYTNMMTVLQYLPWFIFIFSLLLMFILYKVFPLDGVQ